jgi:mono/diheme cytochrome c family protein
LTVVGVNPSFDYMKTNSLITVCCCLAYFLLGCDGSQQATAPSVLEADLSPRVVALPTTQLERWYSPAQVAEGGRIYGEHCAECHGKEAEGAKEWRQLEPDGSYRSPPLNGAGHAWHHPMPWLFDIIKYGSPPGQGKMPALKDKLTDEEIRSTIAWFQSYWRDELYGSWLRR